MSEPRDISIRHDLTPGDIGRVVELHGTLYAREYGFDSTFEAYVAGPLARFVVEPSARQRLWLAERDNRLLGCIAIVPGAAEGGGGADSRPVGAATVPFPDEPVHAPRSDLAEAAQLRWFLVAPAARGAGLGTRLMQGAIDFARRQGYGSVFLWTVNVLCDAARFYGAFGFERVEQRPGRWWGLDLIEERYERALRAAPGR